MANLVNGDNHLKFGAKVISNVAAGGKAIPGEFDASADVVVTNPSSPRS